MGICRAMPAEMIVGATCTQPNHPKTQNPSCPKPCGGTKQAETIKIVSQTRSDDKHKHRGAYRAREREEHNLRRIAKREGRGCTIYADTSCIRISTNQGQDTAAKATGKRQECFAASRLRLQKHNAIKTDPRQAALETTKRTQEHLLPSDAED